MRCQPSASATQLQLELLREEWFVVHDISQEFYQDEP